MCASMRCTRPNRLAWAVLRDTVSAFLKFDDQIAGNGMRLAKAFGIKSGESGSVGLGVLHQILTHEDGHAKAIVKLLELD
jgi:threonine dehydratase